MCETTPEDGDAVNTTDATAPRNPLLSPVPGEACASPIDDARYVADLIWHDGPFLSLVRLGDALYLVAWADMDDEKHRWLVVRLSRARYEALAAGSVTLERVFRDAEDGDVFVLDATAEKTFGCTRVRPETLGDLLPGDVSRPRGEWHEQPDENEIEGVA